MISDAIARRPPQSSLRSTALVSLVIGAVGTMALMLHAGGHNRPVILVPLFAAWDISPFVLLWLADRMSSRWPHAVQVALYCTMVLVTVGSLAYYAADAFWPRTAQPAFPYVIAPPVAWAFIAIVLTTAAFSSRK